MRLLFLDDAAQRKPSRDRVGPLIAVGGISIDAVRARDFELRLETLCRDYGFPSREVFKWSPNKDHWMRENLVDKARTDFYINVFKIAAEFEVGGLVIISDKTKAFASGHSRSHDIDVLIMALERFNYSIANDIGIVVVARPSGGRTDEDKFLINCSDFINNGTEFSNYDKLSMNIMTMPYSNSRLLQVSDLVVSITTAMVAGHTEFAGQVFDSLKPILRRGNFDRIGGVGVKIHPDFCYVNLYHWLFGDDVFWRGFSGFPLPMKSRPFYESGDKY